MARDLEVIRRFCLVGDVEARELAGPAGPIVLLPASSEALPDAVAPGLKTLGFMLPNTPLHVLVLRRMSRPIVLTSGNLSGEPQIVDDGEAMAKLGAVAEFALTHNRPIAARIDDSLVRVMDGAPRVLRRGRGYAPAPIALPDGICRHARIARLWRRPEERVLPGEGRQGAAVVPMSAISTTPATFDDYRRSLDRFAALFDHRPVAAAADLHPEYRSAKLARASGLPLVEVPHHHAHVAACLVENGRPREAPPVLGIVLDGLGWGDDGTIWGGEFLLADYRQSRRLGTLKPVAMPGGDAASREPWRNLYAHLTAEMTWAELAMNFGELDLFRDLDARPQRVARRDDPRRDERAARVVAAGRCSTRWPRRSASVATGKGTKASAAARPKRWCARRPCATMTTPSPTRSRSRTCRARASLHRAAGDVARPARRPDPRHPLRHRGPLPQRPRAGRCGDGAEARR